MNLGIVVNGQIEKFPAVCPHCGVTYWYRPGDVVGEWPKACQEAIAEINRDGLDEGRAFWHLLAQSRHP